MKVTAVDPHLTSWYGEEVITLNSTHSTLNSFSILQSLHSPIRENQAVQVLEFADNFSGSFGTDLIIVGGDLNSSPDTPVYNAFSQLVDCLVDKFGAASSTLSSHHTWGQTSNTFTGPGGSQYDNHAARSVSVSATHNPPPLQPPPISFIQLYF